MALRTPLLLLLRWRLVWLLLLVLLVAARGMGRMRPMMPLLLLLPWPLLLRMGMVRRSMLLLLLLWELPLWRVCPRGPRIREGRCVTPWIPHHTR